MIVLRMTKDHESAILDRGCELKSLNEQRDDP